MTIPESDRKISPDYKLTLPSLATLDERSNSIRSPLPTAS